MRENDLKEKNYFEWVLLTWRCWEKSITILTTAHTCEAFIIGAEKKHSSNRNNDTRESDKEKRLNFLFNCGWRARKKCIDQKKLRQSWNEIINTHMDSQKEQMKNYCEKDRHILDFFHSSKHICSNQSRKLRV